MWIANLTVCDKDGDVDRGQASMRCVDGDRSWADLARELTLHLLSSLAFTEKKYGGEANSR